MSLTDSECKQVCKQYVQHSLLQKQGTLPTEGLDSFVLASCLSALICVQQERNWEISQVL